MAVTYIIPSANDTNETERHDYEAPRVCSDMFPTTVVYYEDLKANYGEAIIIGICCLLTILSWILYYAQLRTKYYKFKDVGKRMKTLTLLCLYPMTSLMSCFALLVPRSTILVDLVASCVRMCADWSWTSLFVGGIMSWGFFTGNEGPDQTARISRLIWAFVDRTGHKDPFRTYHITYHGPVVSSNYLSLCIYVFITLIFHYYGGKASMIETLAPEKVSIRTPPCCCCCCCLPLVKVNKKNIRKLETLTMQIAVVVPFVLFIKAVLWTDDQNVFEGVNPTNALFYINIATVASTLFAMYGLVVMVKASQKILQKHRIRMKFFVLQLVLICTNLQSAIIGILYRFNIPSCRGVIGTKVRGSVIQHMILVVEMFLLAIWASQAYKKAESRNLADTYMNDASDTTLVAHKPGQKGTVATTTEDLHSYITIETEEPPGKSLP